MKIVKIPIKSNECSLYYSFINGSQTEPEGRRGLMHLIEHLHFRDSSSSRVEDCKRTLFECGANFNAFTSDYLVSFYVNFLPEDFYKIVEKFKPLVFSPTFLDEDIAIEKQVVLREFSDYEDDPSTIGFMKFMDHCYGKFHDTLGEKEDIANANSAIISELYNDTFSYENLIVYLAGPSDFINSVTTEDLLKCESNLPRKVSRIKFNSYTYNPPKFNSYDKGLNSTYLYKAFSVPGLKDRNLRICLEMAAEMLGADMLSPLFKELREKNGWVYGAQSAFNIGMFDDRFMIFSQIDPKFKNEVLVKIDNILNTFLHDQERFDLIKRKMISKKRWSSVNANLASMELLNEEVNGFKSPSIDEISSISFDDFKNKLIGSGLLNPDNFTSFIMM